MKIFIIVAIYVALGIGCSKPTSTPDAPAEPVVTESQKIITQIQSFADKAYPGWRVVAQQQDNYLTGTSQADYYYAVLEREGNEKVILTAILKVEQEDGTERQIVFEPKYLPRTELSP